jgi:hypothetical protein
VPGGLRIAILGPLEVRARSGLAVEVAGARLRRLLLRLALDPGRVVTSAQLVEAVWDDHPPAGAANALQTLVSRLRRLLPGVLESSPSGYRLAVDAEAVDAVRFEALALAGRQQLGRDPDRARALLGEALALWRGPALADAATAAFAGPAVARLDGLRLQALEDRVEADLAAGATDRLVAELEELAFDEVKTGVTAAPGGATERYGVTPDIICLAKAIGGGLSTAAIGGSQAVMDHITSGHYDQVGTFNGNPLAMAAAGAALTQVLTPAAYRQIAGLQERMVEGVEKILGRTGLPAYVVAVGAKGCVTFSPTPVRNYRDFLAIDDRWSHCHWLYQHNGGVFLPPWGKAEQWLLSAQHTGEDVDRFLANFAAFADDVSR